MFDPLTHGAPVPLTTSATPMGPDSAEHACPGQHESGNMVAESEAFSWTAAVAAVVSRGPPLRQYRFLMR